MIRNLKILSAAAMALAVFGAIGVSGAQGAEGHCSAELCKITVLPDGTPGVAGKTAHLVFILRQGAQSLSATCQKVSGEGMVATKTFKTIQIGNIVYSNCEVVGISATIRMNGCEYHIVSPGVIPHDATTQIKCPTGKEIEVEVPPTGCLFKVGATNVLGGGLKFHDAETGGIKKELITAETTVTKIPLTISNNLCVPLVAGAATGEITTWNSEFTGETTAGVMADLWWE